MHTVRPAPSQLFCRQTEKETATKSGILLTPTIEAPKIAEVINVGDSVAGYKQRDRIVYKPYATNEIRLNGAEFFLIDQEDVLGTVIETDV